MVFPWKWPFIFYILCSQFKSPSTPSFQCFTLIHMQWSTTMCQAPRKVQGMVPRCGPCPWGGHSDGGWGDLIYKQLCAAQHNQCHAEGSARQGASPLLLKEEEWLCKSSRGSRDLELGSAGCIGAQCAVRGYPVGEAEKVLGTSQYQYSEKVPCCLRSQSEGCCKWLLAPSLASFLS